MALDDKSAEFHDFFERHHAELARLARLLTGEAETADDLAADAFVALWHRWDRVLHADHPVAYARGVVTDMARARVRELTRERRRIRLLRALRPRHAQSRGGGAVMDVPRALARLPFRRRACVVLRHALDLSEKDTALVLGTSRGTVRSRTSKAVAELQRLLGAQAADELTGTRN
ncbi:SigE family RNA polymerase sigma factor [Streptomyces sp. NPDC058674]|uniref:SigE family RNA polymerase sigma factor n=1 Tax=Streptomyces sp. NPDC058674 TaxID=3346592 RepID=UPI003665F457